MKKKLPGVFPGKVKKNSGNNTQVFYSSKESDDKTDNPVTKIGVEKKKNINQKINEIFNSPKYVYKADVEIKLKDKIVTKRIVGRNKTYLITFENELIPISDVIDISIYT
ncbi:hypothetical protein IKE96_00085 [bacterium]|nr:hypothetical protein [bacterium]